MLDLKTPEVDLLIKLYSKKWFGFCSSYSISWV